jgi:hypothetical protein
VSITPSGNDYIISAQIPGTSGYVTEQEMNDAIQFATSAFITSGDLDGYATETYVQDQTSAFITSAELPSEEEVDFEELDLSAYAMASAIPDVSNFVTQEDIDASVSGKMDASESSAFYPMATNPSGYLVSSDLNGYATEQYVQDETSAFITSADLPSEEEVQFEELDLSGYATESYVDSAVSGKQDTLTFGYDSSDKINAINGSAIAGGGSVPEGVMVESELQYNAVGEISGYGESAIAQYGAEKQWLVHDDTIVHMSNSAQYALGVNLSAVAQLLGVDETVLWEGTITAGQTATLSENISAFNKVQCYVHSHNGAPYRGIITLETNGANTIFGACDTPWSDGTEYSILRAAFSGNTISAMQSIIIYNGQNIAKNETITKVIGIGRKQSN